MNYCSITSYWHFVISGVAKGGGGGKGGHGPLGAGLGGALARFLQSFKNAFLAGI